MTLRWVLEQLELRGVLHALIGARAAAFWGLMRATLDCDLLCLDPRVLEPGS